MPNPKSPIPNRKSEIPNPKSRILNPKSQIPNRLRPWLLGATCALFVAQPLVISESAGPRGDGLPVVMLWTLLGVFWMLVAIGGEQFYLRFGWTDAAVLALVGLHTVAAVWAAIHGSPRPAVNMLWVWIGFGLSFLLARQLIVGRGEARAVMAVMVALAVGLASYGLYQYFYELPTTRAEYERDPDRALQEAEMWFEPGSAERQLFEIRLSNPQPLATFALANSLAGYLAPWLVVAVGIGFCGGLGRHPEGARPVWTRLALVACAMLVAACLLWTKSRSAYVATILGLPLIWWFFRKQQRWAGWKLLAATATAGAILLVAVLTVGRLDVQVVSEAFKSLGYRIQYWQATLNMIADHPLLGCGPGQFQNAYTAYKLPQASEEIADPHNFLLEVWATAGTAAVLALLAVLSSFVYALFRHRRQLDLVEKPTPATGAGEADAPGYVIGGAACGFLLSIPLGLIGSAPPGLAPLAWLLPSAACAVAMLVPWISHGQFPAVLPMIGVLVLLVNLLAAGGIGFPGVAGTLWLLMALGLNTAENDRPRALPQSVAVAGLATMIVLAGACYLTAYRPVLPCQAEMRLAYEEQFRVAKQLNRGEIRLADQARLAAEKHLRVAAAADPLAPEPWKHLATIAFRRWQQDRTSEAFGRFEKSQQKGLRLDPRSAATWLVFGDRYLEASETTRRQEYVQKAVDMYRQAVQLYPNSSLYRAKLAVALQALGHQGGAQRQAAWALRLDQITPHADKKLPDELRNRLLRISFPDK